MINHIKKAQIYVRPLSLPHTHISLDFYLYEDFHGHDTFPRSLFEPKPQKRATKVDIICSHPEDEHTVPLFWILLTLPWVIP